MKHLTQFITEYIVKKKLDKAVDSKYKYFPKTKLELTELLKKLINSGEINLNCIDTSAITDMSYLFGAFNNIKNINFNVSNWDVSNVENMNYMFFDCKNFDCDLSSWDVSNVEDMYEMFGNCKKFTGKGLENWDVSNVTDISYMFIGCEKLICDLSDWDVSNVKDKNMELTFYKCDSLKNKPSWYKE